MRPKGSAGRALTSITDTTGPLSTTIDDAPTPAKHGMAKAKAKVSVDFPEGSHCLGACVVNHEGAVFNVGAKRFRRFQMKQRTVLVTTVVAVAALAGCASLGGADAPRVNGKVEAVYVEYMPKVFVDAKLASPEMRGPIWVDVRLAEPAPNGKLVARAQIDPMMEVGAGDEVIVALSPANNAAPPLQVPHSVLAIVEHNSQERLAARPSLQDSLALSQRR